MRKASILIAACLTPLLAAAPCPAQQQRAQLPLKYTWNLADLYPSDDAWRAAKDKVAAEVPRLGKYKGTLGTSAAHLADVLDALNAVAKDLGRVASYAGMASDQDTRVAKYQGMQQEVQQLSATFGAEIAYVEPEILKIDKSTLDGWVSKEPRLKIYKHYLDDLQRRRPHTLSDGEERILASSAVMAGSASNVFSILSNADFPYPTVTPSDGKPVKLDPSAFELYRSLPNRSDRKMVMAAFFGAVGQYRSTFGATLNGQVQANEFYAGARHYASALDAALDAPNVPTSVYKHLVDGVNQNLSTFHRYLQLRKRMMKLTELHYYDLYAPLVPSVDTTYTPEEAQKLVMAALAPLGPDYAAAAKHAFSDRWIDMLPAEGKKGGAYSNGSAYDVHPFMLINFNGKYTDVSTVAHELGHTMQSYLSNKMQPFPTANYPIFVAEVASTFNEALLIDYMLKTVTDPRTKLSLLGNYLENMKGTVFRQTQFADFELQMHEMAEKGQPITGEALDALYLEITRKYYGHDKGVCIVDEEIAHEWAFIPHFYYDFYVYQYATSFTASAALSEKVIAGDSGAVKRYLAFLSAGGSNYPIELLKDAGVDMTTAEPLELALKKMNRVMDEMERTLDAPGH